MERKSRQMGRWKMEELEEIFSSKQLEDAQKFQDALESCKEVLSHEIVARCPFCGNSPANWSSENFGDGCCKFCGSCWTGKLDGDILIYTIEDVV